MVDCANQNITAAPEQKLFPSDFIGFDRVLVVVWDKVGKPNPVNHAYPELRTTLKIAQNLHPGCLFQESVQLQCEIVQSLSGHARGTKRY